MAQNIPSGEPLGKVSQRFVTEATKEEIPSKEICEVKRWEDKDLQQAFQKEVFYRPYGSYDSISPLDEEHESRNVADTVNNDYWPLIKSVLSKYPEDNFTNTLASWRVLYYTFEYENTYLAKCTILRVHIMYDKIKKINGIYPYEDCQEIEKWILNELKVVKQERSDTNIALASLYPAPKAVK